MGDGLSRYGVFVSKGRRQDGSNILFTLSTDLLHSENSSLGIDKWNELGVSFSCSDRHLVIDRKFTVQEHCNYICGYHTLLGKGQAALCVNVMSMLSFSLPSPRLSRNLLKLNDIRSDYKV